MNYLGNTKEIGLLNDPFSKECVSYIAFIIRPKSKILAKFECTIDFTNGNTQGKQTITAEDFVSLVKLAENFIQSL
jgi:hypothetical protein